MRLEEIIEDLVERTPGATAAVLADWEGEAVVAYTAGEATDYHIKFVGAHHGILLNRAREMLERANLGEAKQLVFSRPECHVITLPVNREYYLVLTLEPHFPPARAAARLRKAAREIEKDIA